MADSVEIQVELKDKVSAGAKSSERALERLAKQTARYDAKTQAIHRRGTMTRIRDENAANRKLMKGMALTGAGVAAFVAGSVAVASKLATGLYEAAMTASDLQFSLGRLLHSDGATALRDTAKLANDLGLGIEEAAHSFANLLKMQFTRSQSETWLKLGADLQAVGADAEQVKRAMLAITQIKSAGKLQGDELRQLQEANVATELIYREIAKTMGVKQDAVKGLQAAGKITADIALDAIQKAIMTKTQTTKPGEAALDYVAKTMRGQSNKASGVLERIGLGMGSSFGRGMEASAAQRKAFDSIRGPTTTVGSFFEDLKNDPLLDRLAAGAERLGAAFEKIAPVVLETVKAFAEGFADGFGIDETATDAESLAIVMREHVVPAAKSVGAVLGWLINFGLVLGTTFAMGASLVINAVTTIYDAVRTLPENLKNLGKWAIEGLIAGITETWDKLKSKVSFATDLIGTTSKQLDVNSPSREMAYLGEMSAEGFQRGLGSIQPMLPSPASMVPQGAIGGNSQNFGGFTINVYPQSGDPEEIARATLAAFESNFGAMMSGMAPAA